MEIKPLKETITGNGNIVLYGPSGAGKTFLNSTLPKDESVLLSLDSGRSTLKDIAPDFPTGEIDSMRDLSEAIGTVETIEVNDKEFGNYSVRTPRNDGKIKDYKYVAVDDLSVLARMILKEELSRTKDGRQAYIKMEERLDKILDIFFKLPQTVIFIAQEERVNPEEAGLFDYVYCPAIPGKKYSARIPYYFDFVLPLRTKVNEEGDTIRAIQTGLTGSGDYLAKSRTSRLALMEEANWTTIFNKLNDGE